MKQQIDLSVDFISSSYSGGGGGGTGEVVNFNTIASTGDLNFMLILFILAVCALGVIGYYVYKRKQLIAGVADARHIIASKNHILHSKKCKYLVAIFAAFISLSIIGLFVGNFAYADENGGLEPSTNKITAVVHDDGSIDFSSCQISNNTDSVFILENAAVEITNEAKNVAPLANTKFMIRGFRGTVYDDVPNGILHDVKNTESLQPKDVADLNFGIGKLDKNSSSSLIGKTVFNIKLIATTPTDKKFNISASIHSGDETWGSVVLEPATITDVPYGTKINYSARKIVIGDEVKTYGTIVAVPSKATDENFYDFATWNQCPDIVENNIDFMARFEKHLPFFEIPLFSNPDGGIKFNENEDGSGDDLSSIKVDCGSTIYSSDAINDTPAKLVYFYDGDMKECYAIPTEGYKYDSWDGVPSGVITSQPLYPISANCSVFPSHEFLYQYTLDELKTVSNYIATKEDGDPIVYKFKQFAKNGLTKGGSDNGIPMYRIVHETEKVLNINAENHWAIDQEGRIATDPDFAYDSNETIQVRLIGVNHDVDEQGNKIGLTFMTTHILDDTCAYEEGDGEAPYGWAGDSENGSCTLRSFLNSESSPFPLKLQQNVVPAKKTFKYAPRTEGHGSTVDKFWAASMIEMYDWNFLWDEWPLEDEGFQYGAFYENGITSSNYRPFYHLDRKQAFNEEEFSTFVWSRTISVPSLGPSPADLAWGFLGLYGGVPLDLEAYDDDSGVVACFCL